MSDACLQRVINYVKKRVKAGNVYCRAVSMHIVAYSRPMFRTLSQHAFDERFPATNSKSETVSTSPGLGI